MSDLINRDAALGAIDAEFFKTDPLSEEQICFLTCRRIVREFPAVPYGIFVRCNDCAHYRPSPFGHPKIGWCIICGHHRSPDFYCANADKKEKKHESD